MAALPLSKTINNVALAVGRTNSPALNNIPAVADGGKISVGITIDVTLMQVGATLQAFVEHSLDNGKTWQTFWAGFTYTKGVADLNPDGTPVTSAGAVGWFVRSWPAMSVRAVAILDKGPFVSSSILIEAF